MTAPTTKQQARDTLAILQAHGTAAAAARSLGISPSTFKDRVTIAKRLLVDEPQDDDAPEVQEEQKLRDRVFELEAQLRATKESSLTDEYVKRKIIGITESCSDARVPEWMVAMERGKALPGIPSAMWSDWHAGEVVDPAQIGGVNEFDMEIMAKRAKKLVSATINLLRNHVVNPQYEGLILNLGGDMMSGDIHEELTATNERPTLQVLMDLFGILTWSIRTLADEFDQMFVPCVTGNHGRQTRKPVAKNRNFTNFDWLLYQMLAKAFEGDKRVVFFIPDGPDALYSVYGHRYLLTHGDQFRGGDGQIGAIGPITRGNKRKLARNAAIGLEYDTMLLGHWHQYMPLHRSIVNGSLKGYDEYANGQNFEYEPPIQALWLTHPEYGIRNHLPVYLDQPAGLRKTGKWVSWNEAKESTKGD